VNNARIREDGMSRTFQNVDTDFRLCLTLPTGDRHGRWEPQRGPGKHFRGAPLH